jgi:uncharacterized membrane protein
MGESKGCVHLILKAQLLFIALWMGWVILIYAGYGWVTRWLGLTMSYKGERDSRYFVALGCIPPILITLIWLSFAAVRERRKR